METAISECETGEAWTQERDGPWSEKCAAMSIAYVTRTPQAGFEPAPGMIEVLIPVDQALFEASFPLPDGRRQTALVRGPYISVIPADQPHFIRSQRQPQMVILALDPAFYRAKVRSALGFPPPDIALHYAVIDPFMRELGNKLRSEFRMLRISGNVYLESLAGVIAVHLAANYGRIRADTDVRTGLPPHKVSRVLALIKEHIGETISVDELAAAVHMSTCHFARMFKEAVRQPPHVYITGQRMEHAKQLLRTSNLPLVDVAAGAGFQTQAHFTSVFRRHAGVTPRIFRLNWKAGRPRQDGSVNGNAARPFERRNSV
jgi:AraC-like DNA-binding protein